MAEGVCEFCRGTGWRLKEQNSIVVAERCSCVRSREKVTLVQQARIPRRYEDCTFDNFLLPMCTDSQRVAKQIVDCFVRSYPAVATTGFLLMGPPGSGKTHLAVAAIKFLIQEKKVGCLFYDFRELLKMLQSSYSKDAEFSEMSVLHPVLRTEVLLLDELGAKKMTPWLEDILSYILNYRYNEKLSTFITTNWMDEELLDTSRASNHAKEETLDVRIGERLRSRLYEMCETIQIHPSSLDYRKILHARNKTRNLAGL
ncbi:primosomal protein dnaI [Candidatus Moduliflexus flocculans]|uniref:Primosomal protein dnaI n=1 Tax=Candidatus Moduliflexus flocculans TaxID=1499966 RepID=A0A081BS50_9BACT|nr:primosomal protein dnaI [Candidatus Moduliflexus flocculans]